MGTLNRKIARRYGKAIDLNNFKADGSLATGAPEIYDSAGLLPTSGVSNGTQAYVTANQKLYIRATGGWYNVATVNTTPTISSVVDASSNSSPFDLAKDGSTTTVITITATDSEGFPLTFSAVANSGFNGLATVAQDSSVFTITPKSSDSATTTEGTLTFRASDGVNIASEIATFTLSFQIADSRFTTTLIKATGNNGVNTTINDASSSNNTITVTGNAVAQAHTPYHPGGYSYLFDGSGDYIQFPESSDYHFGSGDFTIESWIYLNSASTNNTMIVTRWNTSGGANQSWLFYVDTATMKLNFSYRDSNGSTYRNLQDTGIIKVTLGRWHHVAVAREGNTFSYFVDGQLSGTVSNSNTVNNGSTPLRIGQYSVDGTTRNFDGYIKDLRIVKGTAVYTAAFTPPTSSLAAVTNTKLLTCHLPYISDGSSSNHSYSAVAGNVTSRRFSPYDYAEYTTSNHGASVYFDGDDDLRTTGYTGPIGTGDYTVECWAYITARNTSGAWLFQLQNGHAPSNAHGIQVYYRNNSNQYKWAHLTNNGQHNTDTKSLLNIWHHVALTRASGTTKLFIDGALIDTQTSDTYDASSYDDITIGKGYSNRALTGYISDFRVINGTALYTSAFTPPTAPLTAVTNTKYLTCNDAPNVYNAASTNRVTLSGDAKSSTAIKKYAGASMLLDGTGDVVTVEDGTNLDFSTGESYTLETWVYPTTVSGSSTWRTICNNGASGVYSPMYLSMQGDKLQYFASHNGSSYALDTRSDIGASGIHTMSANTWQHLAITWNHNVYSFFVDGVYKDSVAKTGYPMDPTRDLGVGARADGSEPFTGNLEDFRITKGLSRYPFVRAKETLTAISGTSFLTAHAASITDGSSNSISITSQGDPTVSNFGPASGMKSVLFDGNDYLQMADGDYKTFGSNDFTIEAWVYPTSVGSGFGNYIWGDTASSGATNTSSTAVLYNSSGKFGAYITVAGPTILDMSASSLTTPVNNWYHLALVRNGNTFSLFVDGVLSNSATNSNAVLDSSQILTVGRTGAYNGLNFVGYVSNYRIVKGTALYTNSFTPPSAELKA